MPLRQYDVFGLFEVIPPPKLTFDEYRKFMTEANVKRSIRLSSLADRLQRMLNTLCPNGAPKLKDILDTWKVYIDEQIGKYAGILNKDIADTWYDTGTTRFNREFFLQEGDAQFLSFLHEFRHLMDENQKTDKSTSNYHGDAETWAKDLLNGECECM